MHRKQIHFLTYVFIFTILRKFYRIFIAKIINVSRETFIIKIYLYFNKILVYKLKKSYCF